MFRPYTSPSTPTRRLRATALMSGMCAQLYLSLTQSTEACHPEGFHDGPALSVSTQLNIFVVVPPPSGVKYKPFCNKTVGYAQAKYTHQARE